MEDTEDVEVSKDFIKTAALLIFWEDVAQMDRKELINLIKIMRTEIDELKSKE